VARDRSDAARIKLNFLKVIYAYGLEESRERLRILFRTSDVLIAKIDAGMASREIVIISKLTSEWLARCCPAVALELGQSVNRIGIQRALDAILTNH
jgi:hypothetical protein